MEGGEHRQGMMAECAWCSWRLSDGGEREVAKAERRRMRWCMEELRRVSRVATAWVKAKGRWQWGRCR